MAGRVKHMQRSHRSYSANHSGFGRFVRGDSGLKAYAAEDSVLKRLVNLFKRQDR